MIEADAVLDRHFWNGKKILLTGHTGFKGAWMTMLLRSLGARVAGVSLEAEKPSLFEQAGLAKRIEAHHVADLRDVKQIQAIVDAEQPEIVIHLAAQSLVRFAYQFPAVTFDTNVIGTVNLFEALRGQKSLQAILTTTTDKVYYNQELGRHFIESDRLGGHDPYSASKAATEAVIAAYRASYQQPSGVISLVARAGNIVGGGDWAQDRLIPDAVRAALGQTPLSVRSPSSTRPWQFVLDALVGYLMLIEHGSRQRQVFADPNDAAYNFGPLPDQPSAAVSEVCNWIAEIWPERFSWNVVAGDRAMKESKLLQLDSRKAVGVLGWQPRMSSREAVAESISWYKAFHAGKDPFELCQQQIEHRLAPAHTPI
ncbi:MULTISPECIES: CDP-glucose 4,6-dehydratase [Bradyrhizobium]|uniref:CDP-glucose 4,6-dehydratase n=1 Tax=Bradyrhizobium yuanmingense TaxID=108015 RepID=A0ABV4GP24_9BRAD|nr:MULTISPECIES: CDP-glucose 4,6-dehydratase [Bradyrhizobium]MCA1529357.1 CDP-glucose 4,6-dehydratase [Bradyrhizobium yuanmingense]MCA1550162.1 CDP-glucose 4,6-dehydratase [Bradyrhizobium sp. BRP19]